MTGMMHCSNEEIIGVIVPLLGVTWVMVYCMLLLCPWAHRYVTIYWFTLVCMDYIHQLGQTQDPTIMM